jgi:hypothetical protein
MSKMGRQKMKSRTKKRKSCQYLKQRCRSHEQINQNALDYCSANYNSKEIDHYRPGDLSKIWPYGLCTPQHRHAEPPINTASRPSVDSDILGLGNEVRQAPLHLVGYVGALHL